MLISLASGMSERTDNTRIVDSAMVNLNCQLLEDYKYEKNMRRRAEEEILKLKHRIGVLEKQLRITKRETKVESVYYNDKVDWYWG